METLKTDYLVVGAGAMGLAFTDTMLTESDAQIVIVDRNDRPGGHWNQAYPFVTLHQPSSYYGVSSKELSLGRKDETGLNKGLNDLATLPQLRAYFDDVMDQTFLKSGRVTYLPMHEYLGDGRAVCRMTGAEKTISAARRIVDATHLKTTVPAMHTPNFDISGYVAFAPLNDLPEIAPDYDRYVVIGGGKTGIDAVIWLLQRNVDPDHIQWIMSRDGWLLDRGRTQPTEEFFFDTFGGIADQMEAIAEASSVDDLFERLEAAGVFVRIDPSVRPKMFHGATVSRDELDELRRVKNIVRLGRVKRITATEIDLDGGSLPTGPDVLHVDCSASAVGNMDVCPVFQDDAIRLQTVRSVQPVFSAAFIAYVEATRDTDEEKNRLCTVVPLPNHAEDWLKMQAAFMMNQYNWS
ncbi:MAG: NAD(P)-binding protein, partial [Pseudomonadota bacterium]